jgi:hypothetical protein
VTEKRRSFSPRHTSRGNHGWSNWNDFPAIARRFRGLTDETAENAGHVGSFRSAHRAISKLFDIGLATPVGHD